MAREPTTFAGYLKKHAPEVKSFIAAEFLVKGGSNATNHLNTDPPPALWPNVIPLAKLLQKFRDRIGAPVRLTSVYRSPAYNRAIGGATNSLHMQFRAADLTVVGMGTPADWAATLREMRDAGEFVGGIGTYNTFVHVDVRGTVSDWDDRTGKKLPGIPLPTRAPAPHPRPAPVPPAAAPTAPSPPPPDVEPSTPSQPATGFLATLRALLRRIFGS